MYVGDRSPPQLQALDSMKREGLTYVGWEADVRKAEVLHLNTPIVFNGYVEGMRLKQAVYVGDRSHPQLQALDNLKRAGLTYIGWEADMQRAEEEVYALVLLATWREYKRNKRRMSATALIRSYKLSIA